MSDPASTSTATSVTSTKTTRTLPHEVLEDVPLDVVAEVADVDTALLLGSLSGLGGVDLAGSSDAGRVAVGGVHGLNNGVLFRHDGYVGDDDAGWPWEMK